MISSQSALGSDNVTSGLISRWFMLRKAISNVRDRIMGCIRGKI